MGKKKKSKIKKNKKQLSKGYTPKKKKKKKSKNNSSLKNINKKVKALQQALMQKDGYIDHLEQLTEAYSHMEELAHQELIDANQMIKAQESIQNLMNNERIDADRTIQAYETVEKLSETEKKEAEKTIKAQEKILELAQTEKLTADQIIKAQENLQELQVKEKMMDEKTIKAQEEITRLSISEMREKDTALRNILEINKNISSILEEESLLHKILNSLATTLHAKRGVLFINDNNEIDPRILYQIESVELEKPSFKYSYSVIEKTKTNKKSRLLINETVKIGRSNKNISIICVPLIYEDRLLGIIYLDIISDTDTFRTIDLFVAEIFSSQASISINNSYLYEKIKRQNGELLRLINLKTRFISHVSEELSAPVKHIVKKVSAMINDLADTDETEMKNLKFINSQAHKLDNTVSKVLTIVSLEQEVEDLFVDKIDFKKIAEEVIEKHNDERERKNINIEINLGKDFVDYSGNKTIIRTIFDEMISNGIFYNRENGYLKINGYRRDDYLIIDFIDNGYGVKKDDIEDIFTQFYRTEDSPKMNEWGAGLGLYMVKTFIEHYQGDINVTSRWHQGSEFTLSFLNH